MEVHTHSPAKILVLVFAVVTGIISLRSIAKAQQQPSASPAKVIRDQAEYGAYMAALNTKDAAQRAAAFEAFVQRYPKSILVQDCLEQAMDAYQQAGNRTGLESAAKRVLQLDPKEIRALAVVTALSRDKATESGDATALKEVCADSQTGNQQVASLPKPEAMSDSDFAAMRNQLTDIFDGAAGFCALQAKDYVTARDFYAKAFQIDPTDLEDVYQLAVSELAMDPIDMNGLWYCSKAMALAKATNNAQIVQGTAAYCGAKYRQYHGSDDGFDQIVAGTASENALPTDFLKRVKRFPTPCELAVEAVDAAALAQSHPDAAITVPQTNPADLSLSDKEFVLQYRDCSPENKAVAAKVWQSIWDDERAGQARLTLVGLKVISATKDSVNVAVTDENQTANKADLHIILQKPVATPPAAGSKVDAIGSITQYVPMPFLFTMQNAEIAPSAQPAKPGTGGSTTRAPAR